MKILIAEDDVVTREILKRLLSHFADKILEAEDGIVALEMIEREDPDVLVTDLNMPGLDGESLIRAVRAGKSTAMMPVICTSASRDREEIVRLAELRISDYILKPFRPQDVHDRFRKVLERAGAWRKRQGADDG